MFITILSSIPDLSILHISKWSSIHHHYFVTNINWDLVFSLKNPFFSFPDYKHLDTILHKAGHIAVYSILGDATIKAFRYSVRKSVIFCAMFALFDEIHQAFVPGRSGRLMDVVLDVAVAGLVICLRKNMNYILLRINKNLI